MFIAMNRFQVKIGSEQAFETVWATVIQRIMPGFGIVNARVDMVDQAIVPPVPVADLER